MHPSAETAVVLAAAADCVRGGIAYISYNDGNGSGFKHYAVDLRPDRDHTLQANAW